MRHVLVDHHALYQARVVETAPDFSVHLDELKVDVFSRQVGDREHSIHGDGSEFVVCDRDADVSDVDVETAYILDPRAVLAVLNRLVVSSFVNSICRNQQVA